MGMSYFIIIWLKKYNNYLLNYKENRSNMKNIAMNQ